MPVLYRQVPDRRHSFNWSSGVLRIWGDEVPRPRILVVDDDPSLLALLRILLDSSGYDAVVAADALEGLRLAESNPMDLVLLDLEMPRMDGREFYKEFRARGHRTPVIIVSAYGADSARAELGAQAAVSKPFDPTKLTTMVRETLSRIDAKLTWTFGRRLTK